MFGYIALVIGILIISLLTLGMSRAISTGSLARNEAIGIRTKATLSSDDAWENGHKAAVRGPSCDQRTAVSGSRLRRC